MRTATRTSCFGFRQLILAAAAIICLGLSWCAFAQAEGPIRFEAETITGPQDAWNVDKFTADKWNLWSTDQDAAKKWSGGIVLQSPRVLQDRDRPEDGAPVLHSVVKDLAPGKYYVTIGGVSRAMAISLDGKNWRKITGSDRNLGLQTVDSDGFELWVDDRYVNESNPGSCYYDYLEFTGLPDPNRKPKVTGFAQTRVQEPLGRGAIALPCEQGYYIGWRLLADDPQSIAFNVYRQIGSGAAQKLNPAPLTNTTDFVDSSVRRGQEARYAVVAVIDGREAGKAEAVVCQNPYFRFPLQGDYTFQKCGIADLDGDGAYDYVIKQPNSNVDPYVNYWKPSPGTYKIEAYRSDGTFLWRYDMGWAIEQGIWYSPMVVYDLDGDGCAEVCLKAGEGDPRDAEGHVEKGPEYLLILDGMTGARKRVWPGPTGTISPATTTRRATRCAWLIWTARRRP